MSLVKLDGDAPFELPPAQSGTARATTDAVEITLMMTDENDNLSPVRVSIVPGEALELATSISTAASNVLAYQRGEAELD